MSLENLVTQSRPYTNEDALNLLIKTMKADTNKISDGYHTFEELYEFRKVYNAILFNEWSYADRHNVHKSKRHFDGEECFGGGWFIVVAELPTGQISNHYEMKDWDLFQVPATERSLVQFDGHTPTDVLNRLKHMAEN